MFQYQKGDFLPIYISEQPNIDSNTEIEIFDMDLILVYEPTKHHYVLINDFLKFIREIKGYKHRPFKHLCRNSFHIS